MNRWTQYRQHQVLTLPGTLWGEIANHPDPPQLSISPEDLISVSCRILVRERLTNIVQLINIFGLFPYVRPAVDKCNS